jgi:hypothetical protein
MKKWILLPLMAISFSAAIAQSYPGVRTSRFIGVNGVFQNPAAVSGTPYKFDINAFSIHTFDGNDQASFSLRNFSDSFNGDSLSNQVFGKNAGISNGMLELTVTGPSVMIAVGKKMGFALTTRTRTMANLIDIDGPLINQISDAGATSSFPYRISSTENMQVVANGWSEIGLSFGHEILHKKAHFLKGGFTLKYLAGIGNAFVNVDHLQGTVNEVVPGDPYLGNATGKVATGFGGIQLTNAEFGDYFNFNNSGFGTDLGLIYEYRPDLKKDNYLFRVGVSVLDIGKIKYKRDLQNSGSYAIDITGTEKFYLSDLENEDIENYNDVFLSHPNYFTPIAGSTTTTYDVALPTTLQLSMDYRLPAGFFGSLEAQFPIGDESKVFNSRYYQNITLTPGYENKTFGVYMPLNYNSLTEFNAGLSLRIGPMFLGSGSVISSLIGTSKQADVHLGIHIGIKR